MGNDETNKEAREILEMTIARYRIMQSYSDIGCVLQLLQNGDAFTTLRFKTLFQKPDLFRFEFKTYVTFSKGDPETLISTNIGGCNGNKCFLCSKPDGEPTVIKYVGDIGEVIGTYLGISTASICTIGKLLFPNTRFYSLLEYENPIVIGDECIDGSQCIAIDAKHPKDSVYHIVLDKNSKCLVEYGTLGTKEIRQVLAIDKAIPRGCFSIPNEDN